MDNYSLAGFGRMVSDNVRFPSYRRALELAVKHGDFVADLGTGPGVMAVVACHLGAKHVYAVEPDDVIAVAREVVALNQLKDRVTCIRAFSTEIAPPALCDVIVSDFCGVLPLHTLHIPSIIDARERWLRPGGLQIPQVHHISGALAESEHDYSYYSGPWRNLLPNTSFEPARSRAINTCGKCRLLPEHLISSPARWATLDYRTIASPNVAGTLDLEVTRDGTAHGFALWFDSELFEGIGFSNAPGEPELIYGQLFLPFAEPIPVKAGDTVEVTVDARLIKDNYQWQWTTCHQTSDGKSGSRFRQSTFFATPLVPENLHRQSSNYRPTLNAKGRVEKELLMMMDGELALAEIAGQLVEKFPEHFATAEDALSYAGRRASKLSE
jgi:type I protein arginine methyltransferase